MPAQTLEPHTRTGADIRYRTQTTVGTTQERRMRTNQRAQWYPITVIAEQIVQDRLAELEEMEWEARLRHPSRQRDALRAIINEGRQAYADGEAEEIVGDTFA